jgi:hypothetical protein
VIDRAAETRAAGGAGFTQRLAPNGTALDDGPAPDDAIRAALAQREPLEVPPTSGGHDARQHEIVFPKTHGFASGTGPLAGEARTRPPERSMLLPLLGAALFGALLVGGAVLLVSKPWEKRATGVAAAAPAIVVTGAATMTAAPVTPAAPIAPPAPPVIAPVPGPAQVTATAATATTPATPRTAVTAAGAAPRKPARPAGTPRPEDVGFE